MKKLLILLAFLPVVGFGATTLWGYYNESGLSFPSLQERKILYSANFNDEYTGTAEQNTKLLSVLNEKDLILGASVLYPYQGGTGWGNIEANAVLLGNGTNRLATSTVAGLFSYLDLSPNSVVGTDSSGSLIATSSPTVGYITATTTTATSTFAGGLQAGGSTGLYVLQSGKVGVGTGSPGSTLELKGTVGTNIFKIVNSANNTAFVIDNANLQAQFYRSTFAIAPGITFVGDTDTGFIGGSTVNSIAIVTGAATRMYFDNIGNVGIGTTSPYAKLSVAGGTSGVGLGIDMASGYSGNILELKVASSTVFAVNQGGVLTSAGLNLGAGLANMLAGFDSSGNLTSTSSPQVAFINATSTTATSTFAGGLQAGGSNGLTVLQNGNVGIGTTSPYVKLHVSDSATGYHDSFTLKGTATNNIGATRFNIQDQNSALIINAYGSNALISPNLRNSIGFFAVGPGDGFATNKLVISHTGMSAGNDIQFSTNNKYLNPQMVLTNTGNVGIGTTSPYAKLSVTNDSATQPALAVYGSSSQTSPLMLVASTTGTATSTAFIIDSDGKVGVGTSTPYTQLSVQGGVAGQYFNADNASATSTFAGGLQAGGLTGLYVLQSGRVGIGTTNPLSTSANSFLTVSGSGSNVGLSVESANTSATSVAFFQVNRARGTVGTKTALVSGDTIGGWYSGGYDGTNYQFGATMQMSVDGTVSSGNVPTKIGFFTGNSSGTRTENLTINSSGNVGVGTTSPYANLSINTGSPNGTAFDISTTTGKRIFSVDNNGHQMTGGNVPTVSACGTGTPTVEGDDSTMRVTTGGTTSTCTITFGTAWQKTPVCLASEEVSAGGIHGVTASSTPTTITLTHGTSISNEVWVVLCRRSVNFSY